MKICPKCKEPEGEYFRSDGDGFYGCGVCGFTEKIKCNCHCHTNTNPNMHIRHMIPCCDNGYLTYKKEKVT